MKKNLSLGVVKELTDKLVEKHGLKSSKDLNEVCKLMYEAGFSDGIYKAQDKIDALLIDLNE